MFPDAISKFIWITVVILEATPAPIAYINVDAVKMFVVVFVSFARESVECG